MKFLNKQEQVIDLKLTQYGKSLLSTGKLRPVYYAFFDDGILYDPEYGYGPQAQKDIQKRIKTDTIQLEGQYNFRGVESEVRKTNTYIRSQKEWEKKVFVEQSLRPPDTLSDKQYALQSMLGTSDLNSEYAPAWDVKLLTSAISSSSATTSWIKEDTANAINVPQITPEDISYKTMIKQITAGEVLSETRSDVYGHEYLDIFSLTDGILLDISEHNVEFGKENFEIEVYEIEEEKICDGKAGTREIMIPLYFIKNPERIKDGILLDEESYMARIQESGVGDLTLDPSYVEYFLEIDVDHEIDKDFLCKYAIDKTVSVYGTRFLDCEEADKRREMNSRNIYNTDVTEEDIESC